MSNRELIKNNQKIMLRRYYNLMGFTNRNTKITHYRSRMNIQSSQLDGYGSE